MLLGTSTGTTTATGFMMAWFALTGLGLGLAMPTMLNAALGALTPERSGSGSALLTAMRQVGATIGVAVLGTVIATVYQSKLHVAGLPAGAADAARSSVAAGVAVAHQLPAPLSAGLLGLGALGLHQRTGRHALDLRRHRDRGGRARRAVHPPQRHQHPAADRATRFGQRRTDGRCGRVHRRAAPEAQ